MRVFWQCAAIVPMKGKGGSKESKNRVGSKGSDQFRTVLNAKGTAVVRQRSVVGQIDKRLCLFF